MRQIISSFAEFWNYCVEFFECYSLIWRSFVINESTMHHFKNFVIIYCISNLSSNQFKFFEIDNAVLILIVKCKNSFQSVSGVVLANSWSNHIDKLVEVERFVLIFKCRDQAEDEGISLFQSKLFHNFIDFGGIDGSTSVLIKDLKCIF